MTYDHKISDLKFRINRLIPKDVCQKIIKIFEKYPELQEHEESYKYESKQRETDNFLCLNLSTINNALNKRAFVIMRLYQYFTKLGFKFHVSRLHCYQ